MNQQEEQEEGAIEELLVLLSTEIARDGGCSQVTLLKDYFGGKKNRIDKLLNQSIQSKGLLAFLEKFPDIFLVDRKRKDSIHTVTLVNPKHSLSIQPQNVEERDSQLKQKAIHELRKRQSKLQRRNQHHDNANNNTHTNNLASIQWLIRSCKLQIHYWLRDTCYYVNQKPNHCFNTDQWKMQVQPQLERFFERFLSIDHLHSSVSLPEDEQDHPLLQIEAFASKLIQLVQDDGATRINWSLLLFRNPGLCHLLGGTDFITLVKENPHHFHKLDIVASDPDGEIFLKLKARQKNQPRGTLMNVDDVGLYSVTASKWAIAMAKTLYHHHNQSHKQNNTKFDTQHIYQTSMVVDLTAGVGGLTVALAKVFQRVIAVELDPQRYRLCQTNLAKHLVHDRVQLLCEDAMDIIPTLQNHTPLIIDPPWGGEKYKSLRSKNNIRLGQWTLPQVLDSVGTHLPQTTVGLKLPLHFDISALCQEMKTPVRILTIKKLGPQLFVLLSVCAKIVEQDS